MIKIDPEDAIKVAPYRWCICGAGYWHTRMGDKFVMLHRFIMDAPDGVEVDHINHDRLDNRRANLRLCTHSQNGMNGGIRQHSSQFRGVSWDKVNQKWIVHIKIGGVQCHLGRFKTEQEAADAYDKRAKEVFGDFARLNGGES